MTAYFLGQVILTPLSGFVSDNYGRKSVLKIFGSILLISSFLIAIVKNYSAHLILKFFTGASASIFVHSYVLVEELVGSDYREFATVSYQCWEALGQGSLSLFAFLVKDWDKISFLVFVSMTPLILSVIFVPESPRYFMAKSQPEKAVKLYKKLANKDDPENQSKIQFVKDILFHKNSLEVEAEKEMDSKKVSLFSLFSHGSEMTAVTIKICYLWFGCCLTFVGLSLNSSKMNGNIYINNLISATAQFAACIKLAPYLSQKLGHRLNLSVSFGVSGLLLIITWLLEIAIMKFDMNVHWAVISGVANLGRLFMCVVFAVIYPFSSNIYPTVVRGSGVSLASACARLGGISYGVLVVVSSWLEDFGGLVGGIYLFFAFFAFGGVFVVFTLPEVGEGVKLQTFEDAVTFYWQVEMKIRKKYKNVAPIDFRYRGVVL